ncbi:MAG TPA: PAS domain S-box protein [Spirochaetota bacterium]|nr:PAS domain S-box protein [Spirochaetota bacterium]HPI90438.1 PAS domain S-box protein [Spirochaetota bacterium]
MISFLTGKNNTSQQPETPSDFRTIEELGKKRLFSFFLILIIVPLFIIGALLIKKGVYNYGITDILSGFVLVSFIIALKYLKKSVVIYRLSILMMTTLFVYWIKTGAINGYASIWVLAYPLFAFFLTGRKEGLLWTTIMAAITAFFFINPFPILNVWHYPVDYMTRHMSAYCIIVFFTFFYETDRMRFKEGIVKDQKLLITEKERLTTAKIELETVNTRLQQEMDVRKTTENELRRHRDNLEDIVTERTIELKRYNRDLEESEKRYRLLADNVTDLIWSMDMKHQFIYISPAVETMYGYSVQEALQHPLDTIMNAESYDQITTAFSRQLEMEKSMEPERDRHIVFQFNQKRKDDSTFNVEIRASLLRDESGNPVGLAGITRDISDQIKAQREKEKIQEQLAQAQKMEAIGTLVSGLAHDFNNFLSGILGSLDLLHLYLKDEKLDRRDSIEKYLNVGMESAKRSVDLIKELLSLSKKHEINLSPVDINESLRQIHDICKNSFSKSIQLDFNYFPRPVIVMGDEAQMGQVLLNLCINAAHAMTIMRGPEERRGGVLSVDCDVTSDDANLPGIDATRPARKIEWAVIHIRDTGIGMDQETIDHVYEPFFSKKKSEGGTGLGLAITYNIIENHGGVIQINSEPGAGSCFSVYFPLHESKGTDIPLPPDREGPVPGVGTILVIDDEQMILDVARGFLEKSGYTVITAVKPDEGILLFDKHKDDISGVIIDMSMPGKTGLEVFAALKKMEPKVKAVLSSGMLDVALKKQALDLGISDFVNKPYSSRELTSKIKEIISR